MGTNIEQTKDVLNTNDRIDIAANVGNLSEREDLSGQNNEFKRLDYELKHDDFNCELPEVFLGGPGRSIVQESAAQQSPGKSGHGKRTEGALSSGLTQLFETPPTSALKQLAELVKNEGGHSEGGGGAASSALKQISKGVEDNALQSQSVKGAALLGIEAAIKAMEK